MIQILHYPPAVLGGGSKSLNPGSSKGCWGGQGDFVQLRLVCQVQLYLHCLGLTTVVCALTMLSTWIVMCFTWCSPWRPSGYCGCSRMWWSFWLPGHSRFILLTCCSNGYTGCRFISRYNSRGRPWPWRPFTVWDWDISKADFFHSGWFVSSGHWKRLFCVCHSWLRPGWWTQGEDPLCSPSSRGVTLSGFSILGFRAQS